MRHFTLLRIALFTGVLAFLIGCSEDDPKEIVLDGIVIGDEPTRIKVEAIEVSEVAATSARLSSEIAVVDADFEITEAGFVLSGTNSLPTLADVTLALGAFAGPESLDTLIGDLEPEMLYYVRVYVKTETGTGYGNVVAFTTQEVPADVIVINEGNFSSGDGSFSTFNSITGEVRLSVFASANGFPVAATIQNAVPYGEKIFAVTNAPDKLEVINKETFVSEAYLDEGLANPYSFAAVDKKGYVTNWGTLNSTTYVYENPFIAVVNLEDYTITKTISRDVKPQYVVAVGGFFYVSDVGGSTVTVFDPSDDEVETTIDVATSPDRMVVDSGDDIWLIANSGSIEKIDTETNTVEKTISGIQVAGYNEKMVINTEGNKLYYLSSSGWPDYNTTIYELATDATDAPQAPIISGTNFYGVGISSANVIYVTDANSFQGNGTVIRYSTDGTELGKFNAGRGPNGFLFR